MILEIILASAAAAASSPTCTQLHDQFDKAERAMASQHDFYESMYRSQAEYVDQMRSSRSQLRQVAAQAAALGSASGYASLARLNAQEQSDKAELEEWKQKQATSDRDYLAEGDRIITLISANKCRPVDHVMTWVTYSKQNPKRVADQTDSVSNAVGPEKAAK